MKKTFCDKCGKEIPPLKTGWSGSRGGAYKLIIVEPGVPPQQTELDLCSECYLEIIENGEIGRIIEKRLYGEEGENEDEDNSSRD